MLEKCKATLLIVDDYSDNYYATMHCQLRANHKGLHKEIYYDYGKVVITWESKIMDEVKEDKI